MQTLPEREGDPPPPPDNGQHIALGCFEEYLRFLDRIGEGGSYRRQRLSLPVIGEDAQRRRDQPLAGLDPPLPRTCRVRERLGVVRTLLALRGPTRATTARRSGRCCAGSAPSDAQIDRFWDVFVRPALNLRTRRGERGDGRLHRADRAARQGGRRAT